MNYGKESLSKKKKNVSSKKNMKKKRVGVRVFKAVVICFLLICIIGAVGGVFSSRRSLTMRQRSLLPVSNQADINPRWLRHLTVRIWGSSGKPDPTVSTRPLTQFQNILPMHL